MNWIYGLGLFFLISGLFLLFIYFTKRMESTPEKLELITQYFADFTDEQLQQLTALEGAYKEWNAKINVISRKDIDHIYLHHVLHSLSIAAIVEWEKAHR